MEILAFGVPFEDGKSGSSVMVWTCVVEIEIHFHNKSINELQ